MPTSPQNGHSTYKHIWQPGRLTVPCCTPQPGICKPFWCPHIQVKGCHMGRYGYLQGLRDSQGGSLLWEDASLSCRSRGFGLDIFGHGFSTVVVGTWWCLLGGGGAQDMREYDRAPCRSLYKPSASDPAKAISTFWSPFASNCCTSSLNKLAHHSKCSPWKRGKGSVTKARLSHKTMKRTDRKAKQYQAKRNTWFNNPCTSSSAKAGALLLLSMNGSHPPHISPVWWLWPAHLWMTHLQMRQSQMNKGDLAGISGKQMFWSDGSVLEKKGNPYSNEAVWLKRHFNSQRKERGITWTKGLIHLSARPSNHLSLQFFLYLSFAYHFLQLYHLFCL